MMRRKDREVTEIQELLKIIDTCKVCRVVMQDKEGLYIVPLNYGYSFENEKLTLYFHSAKEGRKIDAMQENPNVCFEMDCEHQLVEGQIACAYGYSFKSVIGNGTVQFVTDMEEKKHALVLLMKHQTGKEFAFDEKMEDSVCVFRIDVSSMSGKNRPIA